MQTYHHSQSGVPHSPVMWSAGVATGTSVIASAGLSSTSTGEPGALDPLLKAAELTLYRRINSVINMLPVPHQVRVVRSG